MTPLQLGGPAAHVFPLLDLIPHDLADDGECPCDPTPEPRLRADGSLRGWIVNHHPMDGKVDNRGWGCKPYRPPPE